MVELKNEFFSSVTSKQVTSYRFNYPAHAITVNINKYLQQKTGQRDELKNNFFNSLTN